MNFCSCFDFKTNQLGTCKHIEAVIHSFSGSKKLMKIYEQPHQPEYTSVYLDYRGERSVRIRIGTIKSDEFTKLTAKYFQPSWNRDERNDRHDSHVLHSSLRPGFFILFETFLHKAAAIDSSFRCYPDALEFVLEKREQIRRHKLNSRYAFVLTGTPLENKLEELYSIIQFVDPFRLGPLYRFLYDHQIRDEVGKVTGYQGLNNIGKVLQDVMIRRKKSEVLSQLPERMDKILVVPMTMKQAEWHNEYQEAVARLVAKWRRFGFLSEQERQKLLIHLSQMRMVCDSTYIIDQETRHDTKIEELMNILDEVVLSADEKVVIFSQWERMTRLVAQELRERNIGFSYLHGGVPGHERGNLFETFSQDPMNRVFLSTDAGGVGLNLQSASIVINLDIPWNPAVLEQRIGRVHRFGQKRKVSVINMVSERTIEHRMLDVLKFKAGMAAGVLDGGEDAIFMGESSFRKFMRTVEDLTGSHEKTMIETDQLTLVPGQETVFGEAVMNTTEIKDFVSKGDIELETLETVSGGPEPKGAIQDSTKLSGDWLALIGEGEEPGDGEKSSGIAVTDQNAKHRIEKPEQGSEETNEISGLSTSQSLLTTGLSFLTQLTRTLSDSNATQNHVKSLVHQDRADGKTYLKIPVESEKTIHNLIELFAGLLIKSR